MQPDSIDLIILNTAKQVVNKVFPTFDLSFGGLLDNSPGVALRNLFTLLLVGEIIAVLIKRHYDKKKTKLFGMKRND